jgi:2OG-Fe(II) oxygenase superfamily
MAAAAAAAAAAYSRRRRTVWSIGVCGWWWWIAVTTTTTTTWPIMANAASSAWSLLSLLLTHGSNNTPSCRFGHSICRRSRRMRIFPAANRRHHQPPQQPPDAAPTTTTQRHLETNTAVDNIPLLMSSCSEDDIPLCGGDVKEQSPLELLRLLACGERSLVHLPPAPPPLSTFSNVAATNNKNSACRNAASYWRNEWEYEIDDDDDGLFSFLETMVLQQCRCDALALQAAGFGARAGVVRDTSIIAADVSAATATAATATATASSVVRPIRSRVHQIWLQTPTTTTLDNSNSPISQLGTMVGYMDARRALLQWLDRLRRSLNKTSRRRRRSGSSGSSCCTGGDYDIPVDNWLPHHLVEASYVVYDANGAYYDKHWDVPTTQQRGDSTRPGRRQRAISVILYLGPFGLADQDDDDDDDEPPWSVADGGELRIHGAQHVRWLLQQDGDTSVRNAAATTTDSCGHGTASNDDEDLVVVQDLAPRPGTLVLFDSASVPHEVRPTAQRGRVALVAWFGTLS